jgi:hypothetical protein
MEGWGVIIEREKNIFCVKREEKQLYSLLFD